MQPEMLFGMALGITPPWEVTEVAFFKESNRLDITIDFQKGATFACPVCGAPATAYDTTEKEWRHLNFFQYEAYLHASEKKRVRSQLYTKRISLLCFH
jgi:transposase